jgi:hypothetical protein
MENPFIGLRPFSPDSTAKLFGRDADVRSIQARFWSNRLTVLFAGSGVGKSSFLNAKLKPELEKRYEPFPVYLANNWAAKSLALAIWSSSRPEQLTDDENTCPPLIELFPDRNGLRKGVLILDQFEMVFQTGWAGGVLEKFAREIAELLGDEGNPGNRPCQYDIRVLISIREEFLAGLSRLDGCISDLFGNYYRLSSFTREQARVVIRDTVKHSGFETGVDPAGLDKLLDDLQKRKADTNSENSKGKEDENWRIALIDPPYLQIACHNIWESEKPSQRDKPFLSEYKPGLARETLRNFCERQLRSFWFLQKSVIASAVGYLSGPYGAKKPQTLGDLKRSIHLPVPRRQLVSILDKLAAPSVRILRGPSEPAKKGAEGSRTYELYHDMYSDILFTWREKQRRVEFFVALTLSLLLIWTLKPLFQYGTISNDVLNPNPDDEKQYARVESVQRSWEFSPLIPFARKKFALYKHHLAELAALSHNDPDYVRYELAEGEKPDRVRTIPERETLHAAFRVSIADVKDVVFDASKTEAVILGRNGRFYICNKENEASCDDQPRDPRQPAADFAYPHGLALSPDGKQALIAWTPVNKSDSEQPANGAVEWSIIETKADGMVQENAVLAKEQIKDPSIIFSSSTASCVGGTFSPDLKWVAVLLRTGGQDCDAAVNQYSQTPGTLYLYALQFGTDGFYLPIPPQPFPEVHQFSFTPRDGSAAAVVNSDGLHLLRCKDGTWSRYLTVPDFAVGHEGIAFDDKHVLVSKVQVSAKEPTNYSQPSIQWNWLDLASGKLDPAMPNIWFSGTPMAVVSTGVVFSTRGRLAIVTRDGTVLPIALSSYKVLPPNFVVSGHNPRLISVTPIPAGSDIQIWDADGSLLNSQETGDDSLARAISGRKRILEVSNSGRYVAIRIGTHSYPLQSHLPSFWDVSAPEWDTLPGRTQYVIRVSRLEPIEIDRFSNGKFEEEAHNELRGTFSLAVFGPGKGYLTTLSPPDVPPSTGLQEQNLTIWKQVKKDRKWKFQQWWTAQSAASLMSSSEDGKSVTLWSSGSGWSHTITISADEPHFPTISSSYNPGLEFAVYGTDGRPICPPTKLLKTEHATCKYPDCENLYSDWMRRSDEEHETSESLFGSLLSSLGFRRAGSIGAGLH